MDAKPQRLIVDGNALAVRTAGTGQALVFVHGWMCDSQDMVLLAAELVEDHEVVLVDLRAHGQSEGTPTTVTQADGADGPGRFGLADFARDVIGVVEQLGVAPAILVGHSMGAGVVLEAAQARPDLVRGVLLIDSRWVFTEANAEQLAAIPGLWGQEYPQRRARIDDLRRQVLPGVVTDLPVQEVAAQSSRSLLTWDGRTALRDSPVPVHAVVADQHLPLIEPARAWKPDLSAEHIAGTGHWVHVEQPAQVAEAIRRFESGLAG
jgi:pimeloyl-ACP methyl ester carboxylesterase